jgi:lipopolysaccharide transport system permease protein
MNNQQTWTEEIKAKTSLLSINFKEIWHYRDLLLMLVKKDYVTFYKQTILGPLWFFLQPILTTAIYVLLFGQIAKLTTGGVPQIIFYLSGITIWNYFSEVLNKTATVFKDNAQVMGKVYFPRLIMPLSIVVSGLMKFGIQFGLFVFMVLYFYFIEKNIQPNIWILATPLLLFVMAAFSLGLGMLFSALTTKYKDLVFLLTFGIQLFMYATPVVYLTESVPASFQWVIELNPLTAVFECFRYAYLGVGDFQLIDLGYSLTVTLVLLAIGTVVFNKVEKSFMDTV